MICSPTAGFLGYGLLDNIPHFATVSYAFCQRFPDELTSEIFEHILNKALNNRMLDTSAIFIDGTHIKASANKKKFQKEQVAKAARVYSGQLRREVNAEREKLGKKPIEDDDDENQGVWRLTGNRRKDCFHHRPGLRNVRKRRTRTAICIRSTYSLRQARLCVGC